MAAFLFAVREGVVPQLEAHASELGKLSATPAAQQQAARLKTGLPRLRADLQRTAEVGED